MPLGPPLRHTAGMESCLNRTDGNVCTVDEFLLTLGSSLNKNIFLALRVVAVGRKHAVRPDADVASLGFYATFIIGVWCSLVARLIWDQ